MDSTDAAAQLTAWGVQLRAGKSGKIRGAVVPPNCRLTDEQWRQFLGLEFIVRIDAPGVSVDDSHVETLSQLPRLTQLDLTETDVTDASAPHFLAMKKLQLLKLTGTRVSKDVLGQLRKSMLGTRIVFL